MGEERGSGKEHATSEDEDASDEGVRGDDKEGVSYWKEAEELLGRGI